MKARLRRTTLFALYQLSVTVGIVLMPVALLTRKVSGMSIPIHRIIEELGDAYQRTKPAHS